MKEARIIFPVDGPMNAAFVQCMHEITHVFGGATIYPGTGYWKQPNGDYLEENIRIADIAYEQTKENDAKLYDIAWDFRHANNQVEVYLRYGNGYVQMVTKKSCMDNGEFDWDVFRADVHRAKDDLADVPETVTGVEL